MEEWITGQHTSFTLEDRSYFAILKRSVHRLALHAGLIDTRIAELDIVVAEIGSNILKHGAGGEVLVMLTEEPVPAIEIIGIDNGPGITDLGRMMQDGMSTTRTLGQGLGAIKRLSDFLQIYSVKGWGTIVVSRFYLKPPPVVPVKEITEVRTLMVPKPGEKLCGDGHYIKASKTGIRVFLGDGLGHGPEANNAVTAAINSFRYCMLQDQTEVLRQMHIEVKSTRGLVSTICSYNFKEKVWNLCGVGNIHSRIWNGTKVKTYLPYNGIIGHNLPRTMNIQKGEPGKDQLLVLASDGIRTRWEMNKYPGIFRYDMSILAAALYKDHARKTDDMSVVIVKVK